MSPMRPRASPIEPRAVIAQWQGDKVTIWSSTAGALRGARRRRPDAAGPRSGRACDRAAARRRVRRQVRSALRRPGRGARARAKRPVKLVFSREEEFVAIAQRREGIVMEFETGAMRDGRIVARKARLVLDKGAYCGEGGFLGQMAAMHACGPYIIDAIHVESCLNYTNNQPSGSVRAPTAPQVCWGLEPHGRGRPRDRDGPRRTPPPHPLSRRAPRARRARCSTRWGCATRSRPPSR